MAVVANPFESLRPGQCRFLDKFIQFNVDFLIVGGYAMRCHGRDRQTKDLDLVVSQSEKNLEAIDFVLGSLPGSQSRFASELLRHAESKFTFDGHTDVFASMRGLDYKTIRDTAIWASWSGCGLPVINRIWLKQAKDLAIKSPDRDKIKRQIDAEDLAFLKALGDA